MARMRWAKRRLTTTVAVAIAVTVIPSFSSLVPADASGPPPTVTLTAAQAVAALRSVAAATETRALSEGLRQVRVFGRYPFSSASSRDIVVVDVGHSRLRRMTDQTDTVNVLAAADGGACEDGSRSHAVSVTQDHRGTYRSLQPPTAPERAGLKLLHRPRVRWVLHRKSSVTLARALHRSGLAEELRSNLLADFGVTSAGWTATGTGRRYVISLTALPSSGRGGTSVVTLDVDGRGTLVRYQDVSTLGTEASSDWTTTITADFGQRHVARPKASRVIRPGLLDRGCTAAQTRATVRYLARVVAEDVNGIAWLQHRGVSVTEVRRWVRLSIPDAARLYGLDIKATDVAGGVAVTGRHPLLPHPVVSSVFVRNGKAVSHRVR